MLDDEIINTLADMIISKNVRDRRLALTLIYNNINEIDEKDISHFSLLYFTNTKSIVKPRLTKMLIEEAIDDVHFIIDNVGDDKDILNKIFFLNIEKIIEERKK